VLQVSLLGEQTIADDQGGRVRVRSSRAVALVTFLVVHAGSAQARQRRRKARCRRSAPAATPPSRSAPSRAHDGSRLGGALRCGIGRRARIQCPSRPPLPVRVAGQHPADRRRGQAERAADRRLGGPGGGRSYDRRIAFPLNGDSTEGLQGAAVPCSQSTPDAVYLSVADRVVQARLPDRASRADAPCRPRRLTAVREDRDRSEPRHAARERQLATNGAGETGMRGRGGRLVTAVARSPAPATG
jgi:hypothetical protein